MTPEQLSTLRTAVLADPTAAAFFQATGNAAGLQNYLNTASTFIVRKKSIQSSEIGPALNYVAVSSMTTANRDRATTFIALNQTELSPTADIETYWDSTFSGALGGQGDTVRAALKALWRRAATHAERLLATGVGSFDVPGALTYEGEVSSVEAATLIYRDDGTIWS